jgi:integrase/recombinase XerD
MKELNIKKAEQVLRDYLVSKGFKQVTINKRFYDLKLFSEYIGPEKDLREVTREDLKGYIHYLNSTTGTRSKNTLSGKTKKMHFCVVRQLFKSLYLNGLLLKDPCTHLEVQFKGEKKEFIVFSEEQVNHILDSVDLDQPLGLRDRTIYELTYGSALRSQEVINIRKNDLDLEDGLLLIQDGKFSKSRIVPLSRLCIRFLKKYIDECRIGDNEKLFKISVVTVRQRFQHHLQSLDLYQRNASLHSLRHSLATHILARGVSIRYVQELLGHESIETTVIYTHMNYDNMKRIYKSYHPRDNEYYQEIDADYITQLDNLIHAWQNRRRRKKN